MNDIIIAKIGGSTLGSHDTTLDDIAELRRQGRHPIVVHGGGATISDWLARHDVPTRFERGLRVTDAETLDVAVAVLAGLVNKQLVAALQQRGVDAIGLSGADARMLKARVLDPELGLVGEVTEVNTESLISLLERGLVPVIAPIALECGAEGPSGRLLNVNADTAAGAIAAALEAGALVFLTDVPGILDGEGQLLPRVSAADHATLLEAGAVSGGMIPKVEACLAAAAAGARSLIVDGREPGALLAALSEQPAGTLVGGAE
ncbi:MAG TPA: acetylglutamate kinase [Dehalococcoidia bacterium]|nr:acetylglutamate kinase [Dehalococcoidia bacterium]